MTIEKIPNVAVLLADGFEEAEAVVFIDIMRRLEIQVIVLSCMKTVELNSYFGTRITADATLCCHYDDEFDAIMMPGGPQGTQNLAENPMVMAFIKRHIEAKKYIAALCSSGAKVLASHGLLKHHFYTTGDGLAEKFQDGQYQDAAVVVDGCFISGKGLGVSFEFAFTVARLLLVDNLKTVDHQFDHIYLNYR